MKTILRDVGKACTSNKRHQHHSWYWSGDWVKSMESLPSAQLSIVREITTYIDERVKKETQGHRRRGKEQANVPFMEEGPDNHFRF